MNGYYIRNHQRAFGTWPLTGDELKAAIRCAAEVGYRAFDTAQMYGNEAGVGEALKETGIDRDELFITTKVHPDNFDDDKFLASVDGSLAALGIDVCDVLLLHWPPIDGNIEPGMKLLEQAWKKGLTRSIGVSNYTIQMMRDAKGMIEAPIVTNQVEFHPLLNQGKLLAGASEIGIPLSSYSSVARGEVFRYKEFSEIGKAYGKTAGQVVLRWILQKGVSVNTMSTNPVNIRNNYNIMDFTLSNVDMAWIDEISNTNYRIVGSDLVPWAPEWD